MFLCGLQSLHCLFLVLRPTAHQDTDAKLLNLIVSFTDSVMAWLHLQKETVMHLELFDQNVFDIRQSVFIMLQSMQHLYACFSCSLYVIVAKVVGKGSWTENIAPFLFTHCNYVPLNIFDLKYFIQAIFNSAILQCITHYIIVILLLMCVYGQMFISYHLCFSMYLYVTQVTLPHCPTEGVIVLLFL